MVGMELPHGQGVEIYDTKFGSTASQPPSIQANTHSPSNDDQDDATMQTAGHQPNTLASYEGQFYEDKRYGVGLYRSPRGFFYLGEWVLGLRHGVGIEGLPVHGASVIFCRKHA
jgi:hypothetical protein